MRLCAASLCDKRSGVYTAGHRGQPALAHRGEAERASVAVAQVRVETRGVWSSPLPVALPSPALQAGRCLRAGCTSTGTSTSTSTGTVLDQY